MYLEDLAHTSYDANQTQLNPASVPQLQPLWRVSTNAPISSGVTLSNGTLYVGAWNGDFYAVDASSGSVLWTQYLGKAPNPADSTCMPGIGVSSQAAVTSDTVYVGGGDSAVYALNRTDGTVRWRVPLTDPSAGGYLWSSAMLSGTSLYMGIASLSDCPLVRGGLARIDLNNPATPLIHYLVPDDGSLGASVWSTPAIDEAANLVYVTTGNANSQDAAAGVWGSALLAMDATTLEIQAYFFRPIAPTDDDADWGSSPTLFQTSDGQQYVAATGKDGVLYVLHRPDLSLVWTYKLATDCDSPEQGCGSISTPAFDGNTLYVGAGQTDAYNGPPGAVYALDPLSRLPVWVYAARGFVLAPVTVTAGLVFVPTTEGLAALDAATGAELWNDGGTTGLYSQTAIGNGTAYSTYVNGDVVAWSAANAFGTGAWTASPLNLTFLYTAGGPVPSPQTVSVYTAGDPVSFAISSDSPWLAGRQQAASNPQPVLVTVDVSALAPGKYSGNLTLTAGGGAAVKVAVTLVVNGPPPALTQASVVNAAGFQPGPLAPGSLFSIGAANLGVNTASASGTPWPATLSGITVTVNGIPAPLSYVSPTQINGQIPFEAALGNTTLTVSSNGVASAPVAITIAAATPAIFVDAQGRAAAVNQDGSTNAANNHAPAGSVVAVFFTGQGQVDNPVSTGSAATTQYLSRALASTSATIGGQPATVLFSGLTPGFVGLAQANLQVPGLSAGDYPVVLTMGNISSRQAIISVSAPSQ